MSSAPPPKPPTPSGASRPEGIAQQLRQQILNGKYEAGERLPSERELAARIGVNRASVREALKKLEQMGMISIRERGGARVVPLEESRLAILPHLLSVDKPDRDLVNQWLDVWELVLAGSARLAVERATDEEFEQVQALLERFLDPKLSDEQWVHITDELTELIALASRNVVLQMVRNGLTHQLERRHALRLEMRITPEALTPVIDDIKAAIDRRDAAAVEQFVRNLMRINRQRSIEAMVGGH